MALSMQNNNQLDRHNKQKTPAEAEFREMCKLPESFQLFFQANPQPMWVFDRESLCLLEVNHAALELYGYSRDEFLSMKATDLRPDEEVARFIDYINQEHSGLEQAGEWTHRTKDGRTLYVTIIARRVSFAGKKAYLIAAHDETHWRLLEAQLEARASQLEQIIQERTVEVRRTKEHTEAILNSVGEAVMVVGLDGRIHQVNPAFERQTGYSSQEVELRDHRQVLGDEADAEVFHYAVEAMHAGQTWHGEMPVCRKDGTTFDAAVTITPMRDDQGQVVAYVGALADVTVLTEVARMKDAFVANVSHELHTPITSIKLNLHLQQLNPESRPVCEERLEREITRLNNIVDGLRQLSRLDQGRLLPNQTNFDLNVLVRQYALDRTPLVESRGLTLLLDLTPSQAIVHADEGLLGQVLSILLTNAVNYTPTGGQVRIGTMARVAEGAKWIGFCVSDTGPGIAPEELPHLFERFFRGRVGRNSHAPGTGLGLSIAKEIVGLHGGSIEVNTRGMAGEGAEFSVWLPLKSVEQA